MIINYQKEKKVTIIKFGYVRPWYLTFPHKESLYIVVTECIFLTTGWGGAGGVLLILFIRKEPWGLIVFTLGSSVDDQEIPHSLIPLSFSAVHFTACLLDDMYISVASMLSPTMNVYNLGCSGFYISQKVTRTKLPILRKNF